MNMSEIERIEAKLPIGVQLEVNQLDWDRQVMYSKRERSRYIVASFGEYFGALKAFGARALNRAG